MSFEITNGLKYAPEAISEGLCDSYSLQQQATVIYSQCTAASHSVTLAACKPLCDSLQQVTP